LAVYRLLLKANVAIFPFGSVNVAVDGVMGPLPDSKLPVAEVPSGPITPPEEVVNEEPSEVDDDGQNDWPPANGYTDGYADAHGPVKPEPGGEMPGRLIRFMSCAEPFSST
jgi:hypothetical protein